MVNATGIIHQLLWWDVYRSDILCTTIIWAPESTFNKNDVRGHKNRNISVGGFRMEWYLKVLKNYVGFTGRARRKEYWMFFLFNAIISLVLTLLDKLLHIGTLLTTLYSLAVLLPSLSVAVRRLHDTGRSGWWLFIALIPIIGAIILLVFMCLDSQPGDNKYGPNPKM